MPKNASKTLLVLRVSLVILFRHGSGGGGVARRATLPLTTAAQVKHLLTGHGQGARRELAPAAT